MAECKVMRCSCKHQFQDETYGPGMRVFNPIGKSQDSGYVCTVCGKTADGSTKSSKPSKK